MPKLALHPETCRPNITPSTISSQFHFIMPSTSKPLHTQKKQQRTSTNTPPPQVSSQISQYSTATLGQPTILHHLNLVTTHNNDTITCLTISYAFKMKRVITNNHTKPQMPVSHDLAPKIRFKTSHMLSAIVGPIHTDLCSGFNWPPGPPLLD